jgi:thiamine pyrophosphate-dependent acetolactate synthase large subunit-like protein
VADPTASDVFVDRLIEWGVEVIFGLSTAKKVFGI